MPAKFKKGDEVIVVAPGSLCTELLHEIFRIARIDCDDVANGISRNGLRIGLFTYKLELLSVYESPLYQELK